MVPRPVIDIQRQLIKSLLNEQMKKGKTANSLYLISYLPGLSHLTSSVLPSPPTGGHIGNLLILQPQGICLDESLLATAIWTSVRSYYPLKQGSATILAQVPQIWNKFCQRHQSGQRNIFPIFRKASPVPTGISALCWAVL
jgi:hypothetical protein